MITVEKFISDCQKGKCNRNTIKSPQCSKQYKQELCYNKFVKKQEKDQEKRELSYLKNKDKEIDIDTKWVEVREKVKQRDGHACRLYEVLTKEEKIYLLKEQKENLWLNKTIDPAHVIPRSQSPKLIYCEDNIVMLGRLFHSRLDSLQNPLTGESISKEEQDQWWIRIVGIEMWNLLQENK